METVGKPSQVSTRAMCYLLYTHTKAVRVFSFDGKRRCSWRDERSSGRSQREEVRIEFSSTPPWKTGAARRWHDPSL